MLALGTSLVACSDDTVPLPDDTPPADIAVGESRELRLRYLALDVEGFDNQLSLEDLQAMPRSILADVWLADLDITPLMVNSLQQLRMLSAEDVDTLGPAAQNMRRLLLMTPDNANLEGTNMEELIALAATVGIPPARPLANLLGVGVTDDFIPPDIVADVMLEYVVGSHPNATYRRGPVDDEHPDGLYPVAENSLPLTLVDVVTNFEDMAERFGPVGEHPGFVSKAQGLTVVAEDFVMSTKVNANALPYKGADLGNVSVASVNSIGGQIETAFDYSDPNWMTIEGLVPDPRVEELTFTVFENDAFLPGGTSMEPLGMGTSPAWDLPDWEFERLIVEMARRVAEQVPAHCDSYELGTGAEAFSACVDENGWVVMETFNDLGNPPPPAYLSDLILEIAQVRLHDGGLAEGEADVALSLRDVEVGVDTEELIAQTRENLRQNPEAIREFAGLITDSTRGDADFYYVRVGAGDDEGDWLFFVTEEDLRLDEQGSPVRDYGYANPGFYADRELSMKVSSAESVAGDADHEKVRISTGDVLYVLDDDDQLYEVRVGDKPSRSWISIEVTRLQ
ncbi:acetyltransferase [Paraliomyxa miuraensis]|uniref:acetyltransferase n=1 Tax=Paraliomyxa miuraensis TaxID=376150 RepID=UPI00225510B3|nr:acetyltransferase [Paraliomyxa miuraensis]MCX4245350.1 acetyltransferase [Paraliomyxa miuraensis]